MAPEVPRLGWDEFAASFRWAQGEHIGIVAPTGAGKTTLVLALAPLRKWVTIVATKPQDTTLDALARSREWEVIRAWPPTPTRRRVILWPRQVDLVRTAEVRGAVVDGLRAIYKVGSWAVVLDDLQALTDTIRIGAEVRHLLLNARSMGVSVVGSTQRPRWVPRELWTQASHLFIGRTQDRDDLRAISGLGHASTDTVRDTVQRLGRHDLLYVDTRDGRLVITQAPRPRPEGR